MSLTNDLRPEIRCNSHSQFMTVFVKTCLKSFSARNYEIIDTVTSL